MWTTRISPVLSQGSRSGTERRSFPGAYWETTSMIVGRTGRWVHNAVGSSRTPRTFLTTERTPLGLSAWAISVRAPAVSRSRPAAAA